MRSFDNELQKYLAGKESADEALTAAQAAWTKSFAA